MPLFGFPVVLVIEPELGLDLIGCRAVHVEPDVPVHLVPYRRDGERHDEHGESRGNRVPEAHGRQEDAAGEHPEPVRQAVDQEEEREMCIRDSPIVSAAYACV